MRLPLGAVIEPPQRVPHSDLDEPRSSALNDFQKKPWEDKKYAAGHWSWSAVEMTAETAVLVAIPGSGAAVRVGEKAAEEAALKGAAAAAVKRGTKEAVEEAAEHGGEAAARKAAAEALEQRLARKIRSLEKRRDEHIAKLEAFRKNPELFDNLGYLQNAPSDEVRKKIVSTRIRHLEHEIENFEKQIAEAGRGIER